MPDLIFYTLVFVVALGVLIVVHEFGHFIVAKRLGVRILRFSVGIGPILFSRRVGETEYALSAVPIGGYVKMLGEEDGETVEAGDADRAFSARPLAHRALIVAAGPLFNLGFALVVYGVLHLCYGIAQPSDLPRVAAVTPDMPAAVAGIVSGDLVTTIDGERVASWDELAGRIRDSRGRAMTFTVERDGRQLVMTLTPQRREAKDLFGEVTGEMYMVGIVRDMDIVPVSPGRAVVLALERTGAVTLMVYEGLYRIITGRISARELGGPIAIARTAGEQAEQGLGPFFNALGFLSVNLAVLNFLPIPVLDGGHLLFFLVELIRRRPLRARHREIAQQMGLLILVSLMIFVFYNDIQRLLQG